MKLSRRFISCLLYEVRIEIKLLFLVMIEAGSDCSPMSGFGHSNVGMAFSSDSNTVSHDIFR